MFRCIPPRPTRRTRFPAPVSIAKEDRLEYYNALEAYATLGNLGSFADLVAELEEKQLDIYRPDSVGICFPRARGGDPIQY